jgi:hypothetical protein
MQEEQQHLNKSSTDVLLVNVCGLYGSGCGGCSKVTLWF